ncbi:methyl-accepting chemotaxis protein [Shewanella psychropiezotolerans]|uniref:Methyl-accepting chemotaxis protein n=1 Tax=Shewanella psychropiezotolerans TaxID=2593655 RepID=A0ABX5X923_9GAMM|nr:MULTISPECIES: methyl-accepting chemotaxis protein [Shewanella]MPY23724.1 methyl-accepting chemotaxis protein [Shewanella sp. YLB-07]QDO85761.1 methyl-accepting chemotaxis protein [Shewanella psychropiezotolerans]
MLKLNIQRKVVLTTLASVVLSILIISVYSLSTSRSIILESTLDRELPAVLGEVANDIDAQLLMPITIAKVMANNVDYQQVIRSGDRADSHQKIISYLNNIQQEFDTIAAFLVSSESGRYFTQSGLFKTISQSDPKDQWFYNFIASGKDYELSLDIDESNQTPTLFINYLMKVDGRPSAVAGVGLSLSSLATSIKQYQIGTNGIVFLTDDQGVIKLHPETGNIGKNIKSLGDIDTGSILQKQKFSTTEYQDAGTDMLVASRYLPEIGWYLVAQVPSDEIFGALNRATWSVAVMGLIIAILFMVISAWLINRLISPFGELANMLEAIGDGDGDLTIRLDDSRRDEVGNMARSYNKFVSYLSSTLRSVSATGNDLYEAVERIDNQAKHMEGDITDQVSKIEQIATAIHEMGMTAEEIAGSANNAAENAQIAEEAVVQGNLSVQKTISSVSTMSEQLLNTSQTIGQLAEDANSIDTVLEVIRAVSEQTNLLALNAAIEAARAGEQGRGFAVVADEVRTLASRSHASTEEIKGIIEKLQSKTHEAVGAIERSTELSNNSQAEATISGEHLQSISKNIKVMNEMSIQIATATGEQSNVVGEISPHVTAIADISSTSSQVVQQTSLDCSDLREMAVQLNELVGRFKI